MDLQEVVVVHCPFHEAAKELYELVDMQIAMRGEPARVHENCRCWYCRAVKALEKAREVAR